MKYLKLWLSLLTALCSLNASLYGRGEDSPLKIQVRTEVNRPFEGWGKADMVDHGKVYVVVSVEEAEFESELLLPLNEDKLLEILQRELTKRGYRHATEDSPPEIILTILYGRGYLNNPYLGAGRYNELVDTPVRTLNSGDLQHLIQMKEFGFNDKLQEAMHEKLYIRVTAWANPADQPEPKRGKRKKPLKLWHTTMVTDDPAHRDLNQFVEKLLVAGSGYFDVELEKYEAFVKTDFPVGYVYFGDAVVVASEEDAKK